MDTFDDLVLDDYDIDFGNSSNRNQENSFNPITNHKNNNTSSNDDANLVIEDSPSTETQKKVQQKKFDGHLLIDTPGLQKLKSETQYIRFKGKGYEKEDLNRLMTYYMIWAHNLYPKLNFKDFVRRLKTPASDKNVRDLVEVWRNEYKERKQVRFDLQNELTHDGDSDDNESGAGQSARNVIGDDNRSESSEDDNQPLYIPFKDREEGSGTSKGELSGTAKRAEQQISLTAEAAAAAIKRRALDKKVNPKAKQQKKIKEPAVKARTVKYIEFSDDEDDEPLFSQKPSKKRIIENDSDKEDEEDEIQQPENNKQTALQILRERRKQKKLQEEKEEQERSKQKEQKAKEAEEEAYADIEFALNDDKHTSMGNAFEGPIEDEYEDIEFSLTMDKDKTSKTGEKEAEIYEDTTFGQTETENNNNDESLLFGFTATLANKKL